MGQVWQDNGRTVLFISERVAMWQSHWQPRRIPLSHKDLRCVKYFANPGKVGKELDGERTRTVRCQPVGVRKRPNSICGARGGWAVDKTVHHDCVRGCWR